MHLKMPNLRVRVLDPNGQVLVDSSQPILSSDQWAKWWSRDHLKLPALSDRPEVRLAIAGKQGMAHGPARICERAAGQCPPHPGS